MSPGPDRIIACPKCGGLAKCATLNSGNTLGQQVWSDGKRIAPMLPLPPFVVRCQHCYRYFWLTRATTVGTMWRHQARSQSAHSRTRPAFLDLPEPEPVAPEWLAARYVHEPTEDEYYDALDRNFAENVDEERLLRTLAWWSANDKFRCAVGSKASGSTLSVNARKNLEALAEILRDDDGNDALAKGEIFRELARFGIAKAVLSRVKAAEHLAIAGQLLELCDAEVSEVRELRIHQ